MRSAFTFAEKISNIFFDFLQRDLEGDLEKLTAKTEEDWLSFTDQDINGDIQLGEKFFKYK